MSTTSRRRVGLGLLTLCLVLSAEVARAQQPTLQEVEFRQQKARAHMEELQARMFELAELIRQLEPDHAARLVLGFRKAREELIVEEMDEIGGLILARKVDEASERQRQVLFALKELRDLLLNTDLDLLLKLERLRKLNATLGRLEKIRKEEVRERDQSGDLADKEKLSDKDRRAMKALKRAQEENRKLTEMAEQDAREAAPQSEAGDKLRDAQNEMQSAEGDLKNGQPKPAQNNQQEAIGKLDEAMRDLEEEREKLKWDLMEQLRGAVMEALVQMLEKQERILAFIDPEGEVPESTRAAVDLRGCADLTRDMLDISRDTAQLIEETGFSMVLPSVLTYQEVLATESLARFEANSIEHCVDNGRRIQKSITGLLSTLNEEAASQKRSGNPLRGGCKGCADRGKLVSELKILKHLQMLVRDDTMAAHERRGDAKALVGRLETVVEAVRSWEERTRKITERLKNTSCAECLRPKEGPGR